MSGHIGEPIAGWNNAEQIQYVATLIWDTNTLDWVKATTSSASPAVDVNVTNFPDSAGASTLATTQVTVNSTATQIVAARTGRDAVIIVNLGTTDVYIGVSGVTTSTGLLLLGTKGAAVSIPTTAAVYGIVGAGTQAVSVMEVYD